MRLLTIESVMTQMTLQVTAKNQEAVRRSILMATSHMESYLQTSFTAGTQTDLFYIDPADKSRQKQNQWFHLSKCFLTDDEVLLGTGYPNPDMQPMDPATYLLDRDRARLTRTAAPTCGYVSVSYAYGVAVKVDPAPEGKGDMIPVAENDLPPGVADAAMMLSMMYYRLGDECAGDGDCYLKSFCRAAQYIERYERRTFNGFRPL